MTPRHAAELERLRVENAELRARVADLEATVAERRRTHKGNP